MNKLKLPSGFYKIQKSVYQPYGAKHTRSNSNEIKILRVVDFKEGKRYFINEDLEGKDPSTMSELNQYEIISEYAGKPDFKNASLILAFEDSVGVKFKFAIRSLDQLKKVSQIFFKKC
jgi:hypothetical protein